MEFRRVWTLRGPNYWANFPVLEAEVDLGPYKDRSSDEIPGFNDRLKSWLPSLIEHRCSVGERGGFFQRLQRGTYLAHILEHVALELQALAGSVVGYGRARELDEEGVYRVAIQYEEEPLGRAALESGRQLCLAAVHDQPFDVAAEVTRLRSLAHKVRLGPSTFAIVRAAKSRGIPMRRLNDESLVQLGHGAKARRICTAESDRTSAIAEAVAQDKDLTRQLLRSVGVPVPEGRPVANLEDAWQAAQELGLPVVIKPQFGNHGRGVATNLCTREQVEKAYAAAREESRYIMVEQFIEGVDHRLLVIGGRLIAAAIRQPAHVIGDGRLTVRQLVDVVNQDPRRSDGHSTVLSFIKLDAIGLEVLAEQGLTADSVPAAGQLVLIRRNGNLSTGGTATDITDTVHPEVVLQAIEAARVIGLDIAGVDIVARDVSQPLDAQRGAVVEVNAGPGLRMHIEPTEGKPRPVGDAIVELVYPLGENGRIPLAGVTGTRGRKGAIRLLAQLLTSHGLTVGWTCDTGLHVGHRQLQHPVMSEGDYARSLLLNPAVEAAVCGASPSSIIREGLGYDRGNVGIVTDLGPEDQLDLAGIGSIEKFVRAVRSVIDVVLPGGFAIVNAEDPLMVGMGEGCRGEVILMARDRHAEALVQHRQNGGRAASISEDTIVLEGADVVAIGPVSELTGRRLDQLACPWESLLAAVAAAWALGCSSDTIREGLRTFFARNPSC